MRVMTDQETCIYNGLHLSTTKRGKFYSFLGDNCVLTFEFNSEGEIIDFIKGLEAILADKVATSLKETN